MIESTSKAQVNSRADVLLDGVVGYRRPLPSSTNLSNTVENCQTRRIKRAKLLEIVEAALKLVEDEGVF